MKKLILLVAVFLLSFPALAQESEPEEIELGGRLVVATLDFTLDYPTDWVFDISNRVAIAENEADLAAIIDDDSATQPVGYSLTLSSVLKSGIHSTLSNEDPTLDEVAALVSASVQVETNFDLPIMARRAVGFTGLNASGRAGIGSIWGMDDFYLILGMGTGDAEISEEFLALFEAVAASMKQFGDDPIILSDEPVVLDDLGLSVSYPAEWVMTEIRSDLFSGMGFFADKEDVSQRNEDGMSEQPAVFVLSASIDDQPDVAGLTAREAAETLAADMEEVTSEGEFLIGDAVGFGFSGLQDGGYIYFVAMTPTEESWTIYSLSVTDRETGEAAIPTFIAVLQAVTITDA